MRERGGRARGPTLALVAVLVLIVAAAACGDDGDGAAAERPSGTAPATGSTLAPGGGGPTSLPDARRRGRLTAEDLAAWSGGAPAVTDGPPGLGLAHRPGQLGRKPPVPLVGETAVSVTDRAGKVVGCCVLTAVTVAQRERGLMQVTGFGGYSGMLFVWPSDTDGGFWMRNTPTPLSIAWFGADGGFVSSADMAPCADVESCPSYNPTGSYRFALEVPRGDLAELGIGPGSTLAVGGRCLGRPG